MICQHLINVQRQCDFRFGPADKLREITDGWTRVSMMRLISLSALPKVPFSSDIYDLFRVTSEDLSIISPLRKQGFLFFLKKAMKFYVCIFRCLLEFSFASKFLSCCIQFWIIFWKCCFEASCSKVFENRKERCRLLTFLCLIYKQKKKIKIFLEFDQKVKFMIYQTHFNKNNMTTLNHIFALAQ